MKGLVRSGRGVIASSSGDSARAGVVTAEEAWERSMLLDLNGFQGFQVQRAFLQMRTEKKMHGQRV